MSRVTRPNGPKGKFSFFIVSLLLCAVSVSAFQRSFIQRRKRLLSSRPSVPSRLLANSKCGGKLVESESEFDTILSIKEESAKPILAFYTASWCGPCRLTTPVVKEVMKQFAKDIEVIEIDTDELPEAAEKSGVVSIPTIQLYVRGDLQDTIVGCVAKSVLVNAVQKVLEDLEANSSKPELTP